MFIPYKRFLRSFSKPGDSSCLIQPEVAKGMTLAELIIGMMVGTIIIQVAYFGFAINRTIMLTDQLKNEANQNLKTLFSMVGPSIQEAGQGVGSDPMFPVVSINPDPLSPTNADGSKNSEMIIRHVVADISLPICNTVTVGPQTQVVVFDSSTANVGCVDTTDGNNNGLPDQIENDLTQWENYRNQGGGTLQVYLYDGAGVGQFFNYTGVRFYNSSGGTVTTPAVSPSTAQVTKVAFLTNTTFSNSYTAGTPRRILLVKEQKYRLGYSANAANNKPHTLQVSTNNETPVDLISGIGQFTVTTTLQQQLTPTSSQKFECTQIPPLIAANCSAIAPNTSSFVTSSYNWSQLYAINVTVTPQAIDPTTPGYSATLANTVSKMTQTQKFLPRNVLNF